MSDKKLILVRHAHRDTDIGRGTDNGLSEKGIKQADRILKYFKEWYEGESVQLLSSPKLRCQETLKPLASFLKQDLKVREELDEGGQLYWKIKSFREFWQISKFDITVACTHGDWIPMAVEEYTGGRIFCKKGSLVELQEEVGQLHIVSLHQKFF